VPEATFRRSVDFRFASLAGAKRIWTIPSIHGEIERLQKLHDDLITKFQPGDRLVYLGNYIGRGANSQMVVDELLGFRRMVMAIAGVQATDIVYLRGQQEEMLSRILHLQFAPAPWAVYEWMLDQGLAQTLESYGVDPREGLNACAVDKTSESGRLVRWTSFVRHMIGLPAGHDIFFGQLKRAAFTSQNLSDTPMLFVSSGLKTDLKLEDQGDRFWWGGDDFNTITDAYNPYARVVRGYDPQKRGLYINCVTATMDNGCGFGGTLTCASWQEDASVADIFER